MTDKLQTHQAFHHNKNHELKNIPEDMLPDKTEIYPPTVLNRKITGRPAKFQTVEQLQNAIDSYFDKCEKNIETVVLMNGTAEINKPLIPTIAGLASHLGTDRETIYRYGRGDLFYGIIKHARNKIIAAIESGTVNGDKNPGGKIFVMKNYGYSDKQEVEMKETLQVEIVDYRGKSELEIQEIKSKKMDEESE